MKSRLKTILAPVIMLVTVGVFAYYIHAHPAVVHQLQQLSPITLIALLGLYGLAFATYALITRTSLHIYGKTMTKQENMLFNAYSSLINFFGPGQSGPIFRGAYLKKRHGLSIRQFMVTMLLYFGCYAVINALLVLIGSCPWWLTILVVAVTSIVAVVGIRWYTTRKPLDLKDKVRPVHLAWIFGATAAQVAVITLIYLAELHSVGADVSLRSVVAYTGVSNFSLFVALTPGAIGIREAFLVLSQHLHHINTTTIVAANLIDRAAYLGFLGILFAIVIGLHAKDKLHVQQLKLNQK